MTCPGSRRCSSSSASGAQGRSGLGHCLGGQLLSRALGGSVRANPVQGDRLGRGARRRQRHRARVARRAAGFRRLPMARRDLQHSAGRDARARRRIAPTRPSPSAPFRHAVPRRDDRRAHPGLARAAATRSAAAQSRRCSSRRDGAGPWSRGCSACTRSRTGSTTSGPKTSVGEVDELQGTSATAFLTS